MQQHFPQRGTTFLTAAATFATLALFASPAVAQTRPSHAPTAPAAAPAPAADNGDFTQDGLKFHRMAPPVANMPSVYSVVDIASSNAVGQIMVRPDGSKLVTAYPGFDKSKLEAAYDSHASGGGQVQQSAAAPTPAPTAVAATAPSFDAASKTVTLSGGRSVTFIDNENAEVKLPGVSGTQTYTLKYHGGSAGGLARAWAHNEQGYVGQGTGVKGGLTGEGVKITLASANGMPGGQLYDTAQGANLGNMGAIIPRVKPVVDAVREASDAVKPVQPDLAKTKVVKTLLNNNLVQ